MKLTEIVRIWDALVLQGRDLGDIGYCDLEKAIAEVCPIHNNIPGCQPVLAGQGGVA